MEQTVGAFHQKPNKFKIGTVLSPFHELSIKIKSILDQEQEQEEQSTSDEKSSYQIEDSDDEGDVLSLHGRKYYGPLEILDPEIDTEKEISQQTEKALDTVQTQNTLQDTVQTQNTLQLPMKRTPNSSSAIQVLNNRCNVKRRKCSQTREVIVQNSCARM